MTQQLLLLLADDDADDQQLFVQGLQQLNLPHQVLLAGNYTELCAILEKEPSLDLAIIDISMPGKNGKECLKMIKAHEVYKKLPVIIMTVSINQQDIDEVYTSGAHYYAIKPYSLANHLETLKKIFAIDWKSEQPVPAKEHFIINQAFV